MRLLGILLVVAFPALAAPLLPWDGDRAALRAAEAGVTAANAKTLEAALQHGARFFPNGAVPYATKSP